MRIKSFTVTNYRSIREACFDLDPKMTVLLAENNAGKSNILRALAGAFHIISEIKKDPELKFLRNHFSTKMEDVNDGWNYTWEKDYPKSLQSRKLKKGAKHSATKFRLDFLLDENEQQQFKTEIENSINEDLPFEISIYKDNEIKINIPKRAHGKVSEVFKSKKDKIAQFISKKIDFVYIPAVRPASLSLNIVYNLLRGALLQLGQDDQQYKEALGIIEQIEKKKINELMQHLTESIKGILPNVSKMTINYLNEHNGLVNSSWKGDFDIIVNDGVETSLFDKGDGIQSLAAFGIIQYSKQSDKSLNLLVEEPETHLHPGAIKETKRILDEISEEKQTIITTHSPLFVNRKHMEANVIIKDNKANPSKQLSDIRKCLGVAIDDNLINSEIALLVEGKSDATALNALLKAKSQKLKEAIEEHKLTIHYMGGLDHLIARKASLDGLVFKHVFVFVDADEEGKNAIKRAKENLSDDEFMLSSIEGFKQSEFEDYYKAEIFENIDQISNFDNWKNCLLSKTNRWTEKLKSLYSNNGKCLDKDDISNIKIEISQKIENSKTPLSFLDEKRCASLFKLVETLENFISNERKK